MTDIGELVVRIKADAAQLQQELAGATKTVKDSSSDMKEALESVKTAMETLGVTLSVGAFVEFTKGALEAADNLYIMSQRTGIAASTLSALNIPLLQNGSSVDEFSSSMKFLSRNIDLASEGNATLIKRFNDLGLSVTALKALTPEQQFYAVAAALGQVTDQSNFANDGLTLMGRGAAGLFPIIKETGGALADFVQAQKDAGNALTDDDVKKVHEYNDAWTAFIEDTKIGLVDLVLKLHDFKNAANEALFSDNGEQFGPSADSEQAQFTIAANQFKQKLAAQDTPPPDVSAKGNNDDITNADASEAKYQVNEVEAYVQSLSDEAEALDKSKLALEVYKAEKEAATKAVTDFNNGLRDSTDLTDDERTSIALSIDSLDARKTAQEAMNKEQQKSIAMTAQMDAQIASSLADIVVNYKNAGSAITSVLDNIAKKILETSVTGPATNALSSYLGSLFSFKPGANETISPSLAAADPSLTNTVSGNPASSSGIVGSIKSFLGFASGGDPPVGVPSIVGENGPEIFVPKQAGTVLPNGSMGGTQVTLVQQFNMSPGLPGTVEAEVRRAAPFIAAQAHQMVFESIARGGRESRLVGKRA